MAHLIESSDTVAVYQSTAWHGLAKALEQYPSPTEARQIVAPWEIMPSTDLTVTLPNGNMVATDEFKAIVRSDNGAILGLHSRKYSPVSVGDFFDLCYEFGAVDTVKVDSAGTLRGGKTLFCSLKGDTVEIGTRGDLSKGYLLLAQAFDGTMALRGDCAFIRTVCNNTMTANHLASRTGFTLRHTRNMGDRMADVRKVIAGWKAGQDAAVTEANRFAAAPVRSRAEVQEFFLRALETTYGVLPSATTTDKREQSTLAWASRSLAEIGAYWDAEEPQFGANWWTATNAVTAYLQHSTEASRLGVNSDARVYADLYGAQGDRKGAVLNLAREYAMA
jgi:phage/plasmid-like protein (TIGR03299 family)